MSKLDTNRLAYILKYNTQINTSKETGIPQSTISFVQRGIRDLPKKYFTQLRNFYQRTVRSSLRNLGASSVVSNRFSWYSVSKVEEVEGFYTDIVETKTQYYVDRKNTQMGGEMSDEEITELYDETKKGIIESLSKSVKSYESLYDSL